MEWTKIPTDLLQSRVPDKEILAITKYQMLWAMLERQPTEEICLRYMTSKQLQQVRDYESAIERRVNADIKSVENHRNRQKIFYEKNQTLTHKTDGQSDGQSAIQNDGQSASPDKIRLDKIIYRGDNSCIGEHKNNLSSSQDNPENRKEMARKIGELIKRVPKSPFDYK